MPNQRAKNKVRLGGFVTKELHVALVREWKREGWKKNLFGFAMMLLQEELDRGEKAREAK